MATKELIDITIKEIFNRLNPTEKQVSFLKSHSSAGWSDFLAWAPAATFVYRRGNGTARAKLDQFIAAHPTARIVGYFSYDLGYELYNLSETAVDDLKLPDIYFYAYDNYLVATQNGSMIYAQSTDFIDEVEAILRRRPSSAQSLQVVSNFRPEISEAQYQAAYQKIKQYIVEGDFYQINLTHRLKAEVKSDARTIFSVLLENNPVDFMAYIEGDDFEILSASPERFVKITDREIETFPVKGTRRRGKTAEEDQAMRADLLASEKEAAELNMITDLLRNDIGKIAKVGTVKVPELRVAKAYPSVWHTHSRIVGQLREDISSQAAILSMLPGGSITGCPKKRAMEVIDELEPTTRSIYTGAIGYFEPNGNADFNIAIRTMIKKGNNLYLQVGGGIVYDSSESAEYQETFDKAQSFIAMFEGK